MRRVFVIRKDLNMTPGKLSAMIAHCAEAYWTNLLKKSFNAAVKDGLADTSTDDCVGFPIYVDYNVWHEYVNGIFTKTICECKNKEALHKIDGVIEELKLVEGVDYGYINDKCLTELTPENDDGTTTVGIWFRPLPDDIAHKISKKYKLYGAFDKKLKNNDKINVSSVVCKISWCEGEQQWTEARYASYDDALKHLRCLFEKLSEDENHADVVWRNEDKTRFSCKYTLFKYDNVKTYEIESETIEVLDTFDENDV